MKESIIEAKTKIDGQDFEASSKFNMPETTAEAVKAFGEDVVLSVLNSKVVIMVQAKMRSEIKKSVEANNEVDLDAVQEAVSSYKPGIVQPREVNIDKFAKQLASLSDEQRKALLEKYAG